MKKCLIFILVFTILSTGCNNNSTDELFAEIEELRNMIEELGSDDSIDEEKPDLVLNANIAAEEGKICMTRFLQIEASANREMIKGTIEAINVEIGDRTVEDGGSFLVEIGDYSDWSEIVEEDIQINKISSYFNENYPDVQNTSFLFIIKDDECIFALYADDGTSANILSERHLATDINNGFTGIREGKKVDEHGIVTDVIRGVYPVRNYN